MSEYFLGIALTVLIGGLVLSLLPDVSAKPYLRLLCGGAIVLSILSPLVSFVSDETFSDNLLSLFEMDEVEGQNYAEIYNNSLVSAGAEFASDKLKSEIKQELSIDNNAFDISVIVKSSGDEIYIERVEVIIHPSGLSLNPHAIEKYVSDRLGCECVIIYE
ncbi:MAG: stage III sporulation protein AF [Clostridia bacterium]|nr:stage III sporulation protein AF [Clostridia bacterium]